MLHSDGNRLIFRYDAETLWVEPWGHNAFRVRATKESRMPLEDWALVSKPETPKPVITITEAEGTIVNCSVRAVVSKFGKLIIYETQNGKILLEEYMRNRRDVRDAKCSAVEIEAREFKPIPGGDYHLTFRLESVDAHERIYGMGQYQQPFLDLKGLDLELAHRNSQASVPFAVSSSGYGLLWNNPAIGRAVLGKNIMSFEAYSTTLLDYWIVAGETPAAIVQTYASVTGTVPMMPEYGLGFWQCKLRYQTQDELLDVAREYKRRDLPLDLIVVDFFHWPLQGEWKFDPTYWPDPGAMVRELKSMNIELMVSVWPTVDKRSENYAEMLERGYLIRTERGIRTAMDIEGDTIHWDVTNPEARDYVWQKAKDNYLSHGIKTFWLDEAEPEYTVYDFDNYRYYRGSNLRIGNIYPVNYSQAFYEGQTATGQQNPVNLVRCAWAGSQRFGALVWSGDIASSWEALRNQLVAGLNMGLAGIPWWTTDIGGFHGGDPTDPVFRELFVRWFQWGTFCPVMRLHGDREPRQPQQGATGGATCCSGAPNEVWSYGPDVYSICKKYMLLREELRDYTRCLMHEAHQTGNPIMRTLFFEFPNDPECWKTEDEYMYGSKYLCAPILYPGLKTRKVYLPRDAQWENLENKRTYNGSQVVEIDCSIDSMPVFIRK